MSARGSRVPLVAGNWKMYKTASEARAYVEELLALAPGIAAASAGAAGAQVAICAPFTALRAVADAAAGSRLAVLAQNMHHEAEGAFTGEVSAPMLLEAGARGVVLGHSERRALFGESDRELALKVPAALREGLLPVLCVGETEEQRTAGEMERTLRHQVTEDLAAVQDADLAGLVVAYEPVWAIGTGRVASAEQAQEACAFIRALIGARSDEAAEQVRVIYGGSVKPENAGELLALPDVDGALVGGASLQAGAFAEIVGAAA